MPQRRHRFWTSVARFPARSLVIFGAGMLAGGLLFHGPAPALATNVDATYAKLRVFSQVLSYVQSNYVDNISEDELVYDAVSGMLKDLDPHTTFMRPAEYNKLKEDTAGEFGGLGIDVGEHPKGILIEGVREDGPAARAGLAVGDIILGIDGESIAKVPLPQSVPLLRGVPGTKVVLEVERQKWSKPRDIPLVRRHVRVKSVVGESLGNQIGYVAIRSFQERTDHDLGEVLARLRRGERGGTLKGLVLDLRDNPGGLLDEGVKVADRFLAEGTIVRTEGRNPRNAEVEVAHRRGTEPAYPIAILVNDGTASASEIVAGALQDHRRAKIVGTRSYGKGSVQTLFGLDDGSGLKLTVARYFTPSGRSIQEKGIVPDVVADRSSEAPPVAETFGPKVARDPQLAFAVHSLFRSHHARR